MRQEIRLTEERMSKVNSTKSILGTENTKQSQERDRERQYQGGDIVARGNLGRLNVRIQHFSKLLLLDLD